MTVHLALNLPSAVEKFFLRENNGEVYLYKYKAKYFFVGIKALLKHHFEKM